MRIETRSRRLRSSIRRVLAALPTAHRVKIRAFVVRILSMNSWTPTDFSEPDFERSAAQVIPHGDLNHVFLPGANIAFNLPVCRLFSDTALDGIIAHEFAHIVRATKLGDNWFDPGERYDAEERLADRQAVRWGFRDEIQAMRRERRESVNPALEKRRATIMRQMARAIENRERSTRARWDARDGATARRQE